MYASLCKEGRVTKAICTVKRITFDRSSHSFNCANNRRCFNRLVRVRQKNRDHPRDDDWTRVKQTALYFVDTKGINVSSLSTVARVEINFCTENHVSLFPEENRRSRGREDFLVPAWHDMTWKTKSEVVTAIEILYRAFFDYFCIRGGIGLSVASTKVRVSRDRVDCPYHETRTTKSFPFAPFWFHVRRYQQIIVYAHSFLRMFVESLSYSINL